MELVAAAEELMVEELDLTSTDAPKAASFTSPKVHSDVDAKAVVEDPTKIPEIDSLSEIQEDDSFVLEPLQFANEVRFRHEFKVE